MRISDWSSDVCSSDLPLRLAERIGADEHRTVGLGAHRADQLGDLIQCRRVAKHRQAEGRLGDEDIARPDFEARAARKWGVWGKMGSVSVDSGGRRLITKKK